MGILDEDVQRVREATDLVDLVREHVALKRVGRRYVGLCPFHTEKSPSFGVNPEMGAYHCLAGETRVITWEGIREIRDLAGGTHRVLSKSGRWIDAPFFSFGVQPLWKITVGRNRVVKDIYATAEHRWLIRDRKGSRSERTTQELSPGLALCWTFPHNRMRSVARLSPQGIARGIVFGDGTRLEKGSVVDLHGDKNAQLLKWFPLNHSHAYTGPTGSSFLKVMDLPAHFKDERPHLDESPSYLLGWLAGYFAADGCVARDGTVLLNSARREDLEYVRMLCLRLGIGTYGITTQMRIGTGSEPTALHRIHFINEDLREDFFLIQEHHDRFMAARKEWARRGWVVKSVEPTDRVEEVFCAVVPEEHAFALEDNILTGNCFGCGKSGDAITFVREVEHLDFVGAVERLAARASIQLRYDDASFTKERARRQRLHEAIDAAIAFYHDRLLQQPDGGTARRYLRSRGFDGEAARRFKLGYSPAGFDELSKHLQKQKFGRDDLVGANVAFVNRAQKLQDTFRNRVMFPIWDSRGDAVGFGARILDPNEQGPKYKNTAETAIYKKSSLLYGLHWAKGEIVARGEVVICEGYTDVMAFHMAGVPQAVATCGTALADDHFLALKNLARKITLAYDADAAGQAAAERCYQWEQRYEVQFQVADLPPGRDPGDLWNDDRERLAKAVEHATPFLRFRLDRVLHAADLATMEGRARAAHSALQLIAEHPEDLVRDQYLMDVSGTLAIDIDRLRGELGRIRQGARPALGATRSAADRRDADNDTRRQRPVDRREVDALRWTIHEPTRIGAHLDRSLFADPRVRAAFDALAGADTFAEAIDRSEPDVTLLLQRLAVEDTHGGEEDPDLVAARVVVNLVEASSRRLLASMLRRDDERSVDVKRLADALVTHRDTGTWIEALPVADELVTWIAAESVGPTDE